MLVPVYRAARIENWESHMHRKALEDWVDAPFGEMAEGREALLKHLGVAS